MNVDVRVEVNLEYFYGLFLLFGSGFFYVSVAQAIKSWEMEVLKKGCVRKFAVERDPFYVQTDCWWPKTPGYPKMPGKASKP